MATATTPLVFCNRCGSETGYGGICYECVGRRTRPLPEPQKFEESTPTEWTIPPGAVLTCHSPDLLTEAAALADQLEEAGNDWAAGVVRRLAGIG